MIKNTLNQLLETEMDRKDFLKLLGLGAVAAVGVTQILKAVSQSSSSRPAPAAKAQSYGSSLYGGIVKK